MNFTDPADVSILDLSMEIEEFPSMKDNVREILVMVKYTDYYVVHWNMITGVIHN